MTEPLVLILPAEVAGSIVSEVGLGNGGCNVAALVARARGVPVISRFLQSARISARSSHGVADVPAAGAV